MIGTEAKIVNLIVMRLGGQPVRIVLVRRKPRPPPRTDREQFRDEQAPDFPGRFLSQDVLDLPVRLGIVGAVLHRVDVLRAHRERLEGLLESAARDEYFGARGTAYEASLAADGDVHR